jgi:anaerobic selenocysteine-containing dehydrogenase
MPKEIKHTICFRCKPRCRLELEVEDNQIVNVSTSPIKKMGPGFGSVLSSGPSELSPQTGG